jgi:hypothetical protein
MDREALRLLQARWVLGAVHPEKLIQLACEALEAGIESESLSVLASEREHTRAATDPPFERAIAELDLAPLDDGQARLVIARSWARLVLASQASPYEGAKAIWDECYDLASPDSPFEAFRRLASLHEDYRFAASDGPRSYRREIESCEEEIIARAKQLLDTSDT